MGDRLRVGDLPDDFVLYDTTGYSRTSAPTRVLHLDDRCSCLEDESTVQTTQAAARYDDTAICEWCLFRSDEFRPDMTHPTSGVE